MMISVLAYDHGMPLAFLQDTGITELERRFTELQHDQSLRVFLTVIQALMLFLPSNRISVEKALVLLESACANVPL